MRFVKIEAQSDFPREDISPATAEVLELLLANWDILHRLHASAERANHLYRLSHTALVGIIAPRLNHPQLAAFTFGISAFEAISASVAPTIDSRVDMQTFPRVTRSINILDKGFPISLAEAADRFEAELPLTHYAINASAARFRHDPAYVTSGAASARQLEVNTRDNTIQ